jgi:phosphate transport system permease protein
LAPAEVADVTSIDGQVLPPASSAELHEAMPAVSDTRRRTRLIGRRAYVLPLVASVAGLVAGAAALLANEHAVYAPAVAGMIALSLAAAAGVRFVDDRRLDRGGLLLAGLSLAVAVLLVLLPEYLFGWEINGVIHRSAFAGPLLLAVSILTLSHAIRRLMGDTPTAQDMGLYPILLLPIVIVLVAYGMLLAELIVRGAGALSLDLILTPWYRELVGDAGQEEVVITIGLRNHILGTLLLIVMTCLISVLPGIGVGVYMSEYPGRMARVVGFCTTMLRAISVLIIAIAALSVVGVTIDLPPDSLPSRLVRGSFIAGEENVQPGHGSFLLGAVFLSLLVIPIVAKLTEEGLRSVPRELREGSIAAGATEGYGLRRLLLPWAAPNIITGLLLGAAEAAGSLVIILFLADDGENGVGPLNPVTGLDFALYSTRNGTQAFISTMGYRAETDYAYTIALLLLMITLGLTLLAMLVRRRFARRYRGSLTIG